MTMPAAVKPGRTASPESPTRDLNLYNWSEYIDPSLITQFEEELGVAVAETFFDSNETMLAQIDAGGAAYDLIVPSDYMVQTMIEGELLLPLNRDAIPNIENLDPEFTGLPFDPNGAYSVPYQWGTTGLAFPLELIPDPSQVSWGVIFDPEMSEPFAGRSRCSTTSGRPSGAALKYLGYSLNSTNEDEINEAAKLVRAAKDRIRDLRQRRLRRPADVRGDPHRPRLQRQLLPVVRRGGRLGDVRLCGAIEGGTVWVDNMAIPVTAQSVCTAHAFINFIMDAENGATLTNFNFYASPNAAARTDLPRRSSRILRHLPARGRDGQHGGHLRRR